MLFFANTFIDCIGMLGNTEYVYKFINFYKRFSSIAIWFF